MLDAFFHLFEMDLLQKSFLATEITEKNEFKSSFSKVSVYSVAVLSTYARGLKVFKPALQVADASWVRA